MLLLILAIGSFFRLHRLDSIPPGLYHDEAINGNDALQALETRHFQPFYRENNGREGLLINLTAISFSLFGQSIRSLRLVPAISGILTILGLYLLAKALLEWRIAAVASYLLAILFWHVNFSRISFAGILAPLCLVFALYFFWFSLQKPSTIGFLCAGGFFGLGFHTYIAFRIMPLVALVSLLAWFREARKEKDYASTRRKILNGLLIASLAGIVVVLPLAQYFLAHPEDSVERIQQLSALETTSPLVTIATNTAQMLGMFNFKGDQNWRHNIAGAPMLVWPIGILFLVGCIRNIQVLILSSRTGKGFPAARVLLLSWFLLGLTPAILSVEGIPHALRSLVVAPVVCIFAAEGLLWVVEGVQSYSIRVKALGPARPAFLSITLLVLFLGAVGFLEYNRYFVTWAANPNVFDAFEHQYITIGKGLDHLPREQMKYVVVNARGILVHGIPMPAQTVMFVTDTATSEKQKAKNLYYLSVDQYLKHQFDPKSVLVRLNAPGSH